jgi:hypothetical protein
MLTTRRVRLLTDPMLEHSFFGLPRARRPRWMLAIWMTCGWC